MPTQLSFEIQTGSIFRNLAKEIVIKFQQQDSRAKDSLQFVAQKTGVAYTTIRNLLKTDASISDKTLRKIIARLRPSVSLEEIIKHSILPTNDSKCTTLPLNKILPLLPEEKANTLKKNFSHNLENSLGTELFAEYFSNPDYYQIIAYAISARGTTRAEIIDEFGRKGERKLNKLIELGLIQEENGKIDVEDHGTAVGFDMQTSTKLAKNSLNLSIDENDSNKFTTYQLNSYDDRAKKEIIEILRETYIKISKIPHSKEGKHLLSTSLLLNSLNH